MKVTLEKCEREFKRKGFKYEPWCTYDASRDIFNKKIASFDNKEEALKELEKYETEIREIGNLIYVTEYAIACYEEDCVDYISLSKCENI